MVQAGNVLSEDAEEGTILFLNVALPQDNDRVC